MQDRKTPPTTNSPILFDRAALDTPLGHIGPSNPELRTEVRAELKKSPNVELTNKIEQLKKFQELPVDIQLSVLNDILADLSVGKLDYVINLLTQSNCYAKYHPWTSEALSKREAIQLSFQLLAGDIGTAAEQVTDIRVKLIQAADIAVVNYIYPLVENLKFEANSPEKIKAAEALSERLPKSVHFDALFISEHCTLQQPTEQQPYLLIYSNAPLTIENNLPVFGFLTFLEGDHVAPVIFIDATKNSTNDILRHEDAHYRTNVFAQIGFPAIEGKLIDELCSILSETDSPPAITDIILKTKTYIERFTSDRILYIAKLLIECEKPENSHRALSITRETNHFLADLEQYKDGTQCIFPKALVNTFVKIDSLEQSNFSRDVIVQLLRQCGAFEKFCSAADILLSK